jgi:hypothetical protein
MAIIVLVFVLCAFCLGAVIGYAHRSARPRCKHVWLEVSRTFTEPIKESHHLYWITDIERPKHLTGFTTILFRCEHCSEIRQQEMPGHVHEPKVVPLRRVKS